MTSQLVSELWERAVLAALRRRDEGAPRPAERLDALHGGDGELAARVADHGGAGHRSHGQLVPHARRRELERDASLCRDAARAVQKGETRGASGVGPRAGVVRLVSAARLCRGPRKASTQSPGQPRGRSLRNEAGPDAPSLSPLFCTRRARQLGEGAAAEQQDVRRRQCVEVSQRKLIGCHLGH